MGDFCRVRRNVPSCHTSSIGHGIPDTTLEGGSGDNKTNGGWQRHTGHPGRWMATMLRAETSGSWSGNMTRRSMDAPIWKNQAEWRVTRLTANRVTRTMAAQALVAILYRVRGGLSSISAILALDASRGLEGVSLVIDETAPS